MKRAFNNYFRGTFCKKCNSLVGGKRGQHSSVGISQHGIFRVDTNTHFSGEQKNLYIKIGEKKSADADPR